MFRFQLAPRDLVSAGSCRWHTIPARAMVSLKLAGALTTPSITCKNEKGLPQHRDHEESDVFILSGAEDLVPVLRPDASQRRVSDEFERDGYAVKLYCLRIARIADGDVYWRSPNKDNVVTVCGSTRESHICDHAYESHISSRLSSLSFAPKVMQSSQVCEDDHGIDLTQANERNRVRTANRYVKRIQYGNRKPLWHFGRDARKTGWMFEIAFDFGDEEYRELPPDPRAEVFVESSADSSLLRQWPEREDPFSRYRSGFEVRTYRLCRRVLLCHHLPHELDTEQYSVQSIELEYQHRRIGSFLTHATHCGYSNKIYWSVSQKEHADLELTYSSNHLNMKSSMKL